MDEVLSNLNKYEVKKLVKYMKHAKLVASRGVTGTQPPPRLELRIDFKLNGPRGLHDYLTREEKEPLVKMSSEWES